MKPRTRRKAEEIVVAITADEQIEFEREGLMGCTVHPFEFSIFMNGWLAAQVGFDGGAIVGIGTEDTLIRVIKEAVN